MMNDWELERPAEMNRCAKNLSRVGRSHHGREIAP